MKAIMQNEFGNEQTLYLGDIEIPELSQDEVLIKLSYVGIGQWDIFEREGGYEKLLNLNSKFPYILGSEGVGEIIKIGNEVTHYKIGDIVNAVKFLNKKGGFYAEYVIIPVDFIYKKPEYLSIDQSSSISGVGLTAFRGIIDVLQAKNDDDILIFGASGGVGHVAVQIAQSLGANVYAVASGTDGVEAIKKLGIKYVVDGKARSSEECMSSFNINHFDKAFYTAGGNLANDLSKYVKQEGTIVYPNGIDEIDSSLCLARIQSYYADIDTSLIKDFSEWVNKNKPKVYIEKVFDMDEFILAHKMLTKHYVGKLCFKLK